MGLGCSVVVAIENRLKRLARLSLGRRNVQFSQTLGCDHLLSVVRAAQLVSARSCKESDLRLALSMIAFAMSATARLAFATSFDTSPDPSAHQDILICAGSIDGGLQLSGLSRMRLYSWQLSYAAAPATMPTPSCAFCGACTNSAYACAW